MLNHYHLYHGEIPAILEACMRTSVVRRLQSVGMNCGCEYTSFPRFRALSPYSRYEHSVGVALIVWHFTRDPAQATAGLLHDIATPVFAHVVDFMRGDYLAQESTEDGTEELTFKSPGIAEDFARAALACSRIYVSDEDRYAMQRLAEVLRCAMDRRVLREEDLYSTEPEVIEKLLSNRETAAQWNSFRLL